MKTRTLLPMAVFRRRLGAFALAVLLGTGLLGLLAQPADPPAEEPQPAEPSEPATPQPAEPAPNEDLRPAEPAPVMEPAVEVAEPETEPADPMTAPQPEADPTSPRPGDAAPGREGSHPTALGSGTRTASPATSGQDESVAAAVSDALGPQARPVADGERGIRLNFRGVALEQVLNYLSDAAGFIIQPETELKGKVDVWSNQPLTKEEALDVLNTVLGKNGYAVIRNGRMLTILSKEEARRRDIPVVSGSDPARIPKNDEMVTQIIPVRFINAVQLARDLQQLVPSGSQLAANEGGNSLLMTDTQTHIRRMVEIVQALDTSIASISTVRVFPLQYAEATSVATIIKEVFQTSDSSRSSGNAASRFMNMFRGGGPGGMGGMGGGGGDSSSSGSSTGRPGASRVAAVADERSNSVVVSAPDDMMPAIVDLVKGVDTNVEDTMEVRVFPLKNSDPSEMADLITSLFPDETTTSSSRSGRGGQFGGPFGAQFAGGRSSGSSSSQSDRAKRQSRVIAAADSRTRAVVVSAAQTTMEQIGKMITQLDGDPSHKMKVHVFSLENTDPTTAEELVRQLFEGSGTSSRTSSSTSRQTGNQLSNRASSQRTTSSSSSFGGSSGSSSSSGSR